MTERLPAESVLASVHPFDWSDDEAVAYEVALDTITLVVAQYTRLITRERAASEPVRDALEIWEAARGRCIQARRDLRSTDRAAVAEATQTYGALLRSMRP